MLTYCLPFFEGRMLHNYFQFGCFKIQVAFAKGEAIRLGQRQILRRVSKWDPRSGSAETDRPTQRAGPGLDEKEEILPSFKEARQKAAKEGQRLQSDVSKNRGTPKWVV